MIEIIPAIDLIDGKCVRLTKGDYAQKKIYNENPVLLAKIFFDAGIKRLHLVDLDGAKKGEIQNLKILEKIAGKTELKIDFGGGVRTEVDFENIIDAGATWVTIGSLSIKEPLKFSNWLKTYGADKILLATDVQNMNVCISAWQEHTRINIIDFIRDKSHLGIKQYFSTDISRDGMLWGPAFKLYKTLLNEFPDIYLIASGGISHIRDVYELDKIGCKAAIIGKAFYEGLITLDDINKINNLEN